MLLILILKIVFCFLATGHIIRWVSYHLRNHNKKARVFHGNTRMPFDVEFALMYGIHAKRRKRVKDLSYRKSLAEWKELLDRIYPQDDLTLAAPKSPKGDLSLEWFTSANREQFPFPELKNENPNSINSTPTSQTHTDLKSPVYIPMKSEGDLGVKKGNKNFTRIKKIHTAFTAKPCAKNNGVVPSLLVKTKIVGLNNFKICKNPNPFPKQVLACTWNIFTVWFLFYFKLFNLSAPIIKLPNHQIIKFHQHISILAYQHIKTSGNYSSITN